MEVLTLDGPAGSGKSTLARELARALGWHYLDTGAMYRAFTLHLLEQDLAPGSPDDCRRGLKDFALDLAPDGGFHLAGRPLDDSRLRTPAVEAGVSLVAACSPVREHMRGLQRRFGARGRVVVEGRDVGSVVFPRARHKFYLDASLECRARRRLADFDRQGRRVEVEQVMAEMARRDRADRERTDGPLVKPADARVIDTTELTLEQVRDRILAALEGGQGE